MNTPELKKKIIEKIEQTENVKILEHIHRIFLSDTAQNEIFQLSDSQIAAIKEAEEEIKKGNYYTHEEVMKDFEKWLEE